LFRYSAYNLPISSDFEIPWFLEDGSHRGTRIVVRRLHHLPRGALDRTVGKHQASHSILQYKRTCRLEIVDGTEIRIAGEAGIENAELATYVAGVGMGVLQHQMGRLVLHASAVRGPAGAIAFLGDSQLGKSTTAAALYFHGWPLITDDVAALYEADSGRLVLASSFPFMKLWPRALETLGRQVDEHLPIYPGAVKRRVRADEGFESGAEKLEVVYVLGEGSRIEVTDISHQAAFAELVRHSFAARVLEDSGPKTWHFELVARLVRESRIRRLLVARSGVGGLEAIVEVVRRDLASTS
jgi:hypothetical protein